VRCVVGATIASASSAGCTFATPVDWLRTPTRTALRTFDKRYSRISPQTVAGIGITAGWHSQRPVSLTEREERSPRVLRRVANRNIPPWIPTPEGVGGCQTFPVSMSGRSRYVMVRQDGKRNFGVRESDGN